MLAISNDIDQTHAPRFRQVHRFLNTTEETPMGPGLGLDVADSFWFYGRSVLSREQDASDFTYFRGLTWKERSPFAEELAVYLQAGWIDTIHSYGNFSGVSPDKRCTREHAEEALQALGSAGLHPRVWVNHGNVDNVQNIGRADYMEGDDPDSPAYHWDLLRQAGVEYLWDGGDAGVFRRPSALVPLTLKDGSESWGFHRFYTLDFEAALEHGLRPAVAEQLKRNRSYAVLWHPQHLHVQLSERHLDELSSEGGFAVIAQHLGVTPRSLMLGGPATHALRRLAGYQERGLILVARTSRLLDFNRARDFVKFAVSEDGEATTVDILGLEDPITGLTTPTADRLRGLTFYVRDERQARLLIDGSPVDESLVQRNPSDGKLPSIGLRWFEPDSTDHAEPFADAWRRAHSASAALEPQAVSEQAHEVLDEYKSGPVPDGVTPEQYDYAVEYTRHRYSGLKVAADRVRELGFRDLGRGLDIGSGAGHWCVAFLLHNEQVAGIDIRVEFVELAQRIAAGLGLGDRAAYAVARAEELPFEDGSFDVAWTHGVLQFTDIELAIGEAARVLRQGALFYCGYSGVGFRLRAVYNGLAKQAEAAAKSQVESLLGARRYRSGVSSSGWSRMRAPALEDAIAIADSMGLRYVDEPQIQDTREDFLGRPATVDFLAQKREDPAAFAARIAGQPADSDLYDTLERLVAAGAPRSVIRAVGERPDLDEDARLRRVLLAALIKADEISGELAESLASTETDPIVLGKLHEQRHNYEAALELYAGVDGEAASFLAGGCLLKLGRLADARKTLSSGVDAADSELALDCRIALCSLAATEDGLEGLAREFASLLEWLGALHGREEEARTLIGGLHLTASAG